MRRYVSNEPSRLETVKVRVTSEEKRLIVEVAKGKGVPVARLVREAAMRLTQAAA